MSDDKNEPKNTEFLREAFATDNEVRSLEGEITRARDRRASLAARFVAARSEQDGLHALFSIPEAAFEASFAIYLIVKGFRPSPVLGAAGS